MLYPKSLLIFVLCFANSSIFSEWKVDDKLPDLRQFELEGELPEIKGKVVLLDFWATWCAPCKASFPHMESLQAEFADQGFTVVAVSVDSKEAPLLKWKKQRPARFTILWDAAQTLVANAGIGVMPTSFLIDKNGNIRYRHEGFRSGDEIELKAKIEELLRE